MKCFRAKGRLEALKTGISDQNVFHSILIALLKVYWVSKEAKKFKNLECVHSICCFSVEIE